MAYTTSNFLDAVSRYGFIPSGQSTFTDADILAVADDLTSHYIVPAINELREEFFVTYSDIALVSGTAAYPIPARSMGAVIRDAQIVTSSSVRDLARSSIGLQDGRSTSSQGSPTEFFFRGDKLVLVPTPGSSSESLRVYYPLMPGSLAAVTDCAVISAINTSTNVVTVTSIPSTWVTGDIVDIVSASGSQLYLDIDLTTTLISGTNLTLPSLPDGLVVGDYVCLQGTSCLLQMPTIVRPVLAKMTAAQLLLSMGVVDAPQKLQQALGDLQVISRSLSNRVVGSPETVLPDWS